MCAPDTHMCAPDTHMCPPDTHMCAPDSYMCVEELITYTWPVYFLCDVMNFVILDMFYQHGTKPILFNE